jgi:hypothetical protein
MMMVPTASYEGGMMRSLVLALMFGLISPSTMMALAWTSAPRIIHGHFSRRVENSVIPRWTSLVYWNVSPALYSAANNEDSKDIVDDVTFDTEEEKREAVGNLVADDEWDGLTMELADLVRKSCT